MFSTSPELDIIHDAMLEKTERAAAMAARLLDDEIRRLLGSWQSELEPVLIYTGQPAVFAGLGVGSDLILPARTIRLDFVGPCSDEPISSMLLSHSGAYPETQ